MATGTLNRRGASKPSTLEDLALIPEILREPDSARLSPGTTRIGLPVIVYEKMINGNLLYLEEVRRRPSLTGARASRPRTPESSGGFAEP